VLNVRTMIAGLSAVLTAVCVGLAKREQTDDTRIDNDDSDTTETATLAIAKSTVIKGTINYALSIMANEKDCPVQILFADGSDILAEVSAEDLAQYFAESPEQLAASLDYRVPDCAIAFIPLGREGSAGEEGETNSRLAAILNTWELGRPRFRLGPSSPTRVWK